MEIAGIAHVLHGEGAAATTDMIVRILRER